MKLLRLAFIVAAGLLFTAGASAQITVAGVRYEATADVAGTKLQLNGAGIRYRGPFRVYTAALYLGKKTESPEEALAQPGAKRIAIQMLREVDSNELGKLFTRAVEDNMDRSAFSKLVPSLIRMGQIFSEHKKLVSGDTFSIEWIPNTGTVITIKGQPQGEPFKEPEFFNALLRIWLGQKPADWMLKDALLGKPS